MWLYGFFNVAAFLFIWRLMQELTGRSLEQIEARLHQRQFKPSDFAKPPAEDTTTTRAST